MFETMGERMLGMICATVVMVVFLTMNPMMPRNYDVKAGKCNPGTPITISSGGTYSGCYMSRNSTAAVTITTTAAVTLSRAKIYHAGQGVRGVSARVNLTVQDSNFTALAPGTPGDQAAVYTFQPSSLVVVNNSFVDGHGIVANGNDLTTTPFQILRNDFVNVGRYNVGSGLIGAIHTDKLASPGATISWNRATSTYGQSLNEDVIGIFDSNGGSGNPIVVDHNLINGSYPYSGNGSGFTGSGVNLGDGGGTWQTGDSNTVVNSANNGIMVGAGDNIIHTNSVAVSDGKAGINDSGTTVSSTFGNGVLAYDSTSGSNPPTNITITNNASGHRRWNGTSFEAADYFIPEADVATGNTNTSPVNAAAEQTAVDAWNTARVSNGVTVGPR